MNTGSYEKPQTANTLGFTPCQASVALPYLKPTGFQRPEPLVDFLRIIPDGARLLFESDGDPRTESRFRTLKVWAEDQLRERNIELINGEYIRICEPTLAETYIRRFNRAEMGGQEMSRLCQTLGAGWVIGFTPSTLEYLGNAGYEPVASVSLVSLRSFREAIGTPQDTLTLLRNVRPVSIIDPPSLYRHERSSLTWEAEAETTYTVRYRYYQGFRARQDGRPLEVKPTTPIDGLPLTLMQIRAAADGPVVLEFHPQWI